MQMTERTGDFFGISISYRQIYFRLITILFARDAPLV